MEKICVCPECKRIVRVVEPPPSLCYRANEILLERHCSWAEALQRALEEEEEEEEADGCNYFV